jgi:hypothetical protein
MRILGDKEIDDKLTTLKLKAAHYANDTTHADHLKKCPQCRDLHADIVWAIGVAQSRGESLQRLIKSLGVKKDDFGTD